MAVVGIRELRQNLSRYIDKVRDGDQFDVTDRGLVVARLVPAGTAVDAAYRELSAVLGTSIPTRQIQDVWAEIDAPDAPEGAPAGTTDAFLAESREEHDRA